MAIENAVYQLLANLATIQEAVSGRIYYEHNPNQDESEYIVYQKVSHQRTLHVDNTPSLQFADFQIDIYSRSEDSVRNTRDALVTAWHGQNNDEYGDFIRQMYVDNDTASFVADPKLYRVSLSLSLVF